MAFRVCAQTGESAASGQLSTADVEMLKLANRLQNGLAKLRSAEKSEDQSFQLEALLELGELFEQQQYFNKALSYFEQAVSLANELGLEEQRLSIQTRVARDLYENGQVQETHNACLELFEQHQFYRQYDPAMEDLEYLAETSLAMDNFAQAGEFYQTAFEMASYTGDLPSAIAALNNLGFTAFRMNKYEEAVNYFTQAEQAASESEEDIPGYIFTNLGVAWHNMGERNRSMENLLLAEEKEKERRSYVQHLISSIYLTDKDLYNALRYNEQAIKTAKKSNDIQILSDAYETASDIYQRLYEYDKALDFYKKHLSLKDSIARVETSEQQTLDNIHSFLDETENNFLQNSIESELRQANLNQLELEAEKQRLEQERQEQELALLKQEKAAEEANRRAAQLERDRTKQALQLATQQLLAEKQSREINDLNQQRSLDSLNAARQAAEQQQQIQLLEKQKEIAALKTQQEEDFRKSVYWLGALLGLILLIITGSWLYSRRLNKRLATQNQQIEMQKEEIETERNRAEGLLLNILPQTVAEELKNKGEATPQHYKAATVLFTDFQGFTRIASNLHPQAVIHELNECFLSFDKIADKYRLEKIKTMGDAYMCAGGIPVENNTHPVDAVSAALEIKLFIAERNRKLKAAGKPEWPIRIGVHTGELVAGVVGSKKFAYDIWGDTVNVASRMESNSGAGQVNISEATYLVVRDKFDCTFRGEVEVKNKGRMGMYIVEGMKDV